MRCRCRDWGLVIGDWLLVTGRGAGENFQPLRIYDPRGEFIKSYPAVIKET